ncbi:glycosyltransferase family 2 protein [Halorubellus salinus]|uniref:glycosyltransferase family 2 protein n=1 Tax=Halorubellus salinus TaxID=755309 RepID=UPI001D087C6C|nr:glycosyltransferase family 2 protein [Halorubellus salinus]
MMVPATKSSVRSFGFDGSVLVAIPAFNEAATIGAVVRETEPHADAVLVVDDGSDDDTARDAVDAGAHVLTHPENRGYGASLQTIFEAARAANAETLVVLDADGQHDSSDVPVLARLCERDRTDIVIGSRFVGDDPTNIPQVRSFGIRVLNILINLSTKRLSRDSWVSDTQSGFRAYCPRAIRSLAADDSIGNHMGASADILRHARERGYSIVEVPTCTTYAVENPNTKPPVRHGLSVALSAVKPLAFEHPFTTFGVPGFLFLSSGIALLSGVSAGVVGSNPVTAALAVAATVSFLLAAYLLAVALGYTYGSETLR